MNRRQKKKAKKKKAYPPYVSAKRRKKNKYLCERYPFLIPRNIFTGKVSWMRKPYDWTLAESFPKGWWKAFGIQFCEELRAELIKYNYLKEYRVVQIKEKYGCYDSETEVLTECGWKYFKDLSFRDKIATLNPQSEMLEYQYPTDIIAEKYKGKMYRLENRGVSLCVTPNHNLYVSKGSYYNGAKNNEKRIYDFELTTPDKYFRKDKRFKKGCIWNGETPYDVFKIKGIEYDSYFKKDDPNSGIRHYMLDNKQYDLMAFLRFLGFYVAEGCTSISTSSTRPCEITIAYNGIDEEDLICNLLKDIGYNSAYGYKDGACAAKKIYDTTLASWLRNNCGHLAENKKVPQFIKMLPPKYIEEFLKYLYIGDGHKTETSNILTTVSKQLSNDVQELLLKCGYAFRESIRDERDRINYINNRKIQSKYIVYNINWLKNTEVEVEMSSSRKTRSFREEWIDYNGCVYCVTVPNNIIYIRRNGKGVWCGNSLRFYDGGYPKDSEIPEIIEDYSALSESICIVCGKPDTPTIIDMGWYEPVCKDCYEKRAKLPNKYIKETPKYEDLICDEDNTMPDKRTYTLYFNGTEERITRDISSKANQIRARWRTSHADN